jgi:hypothetical protein
MVLGPGELGASFIHLLLILRIPKREMSIPFKKQLMQLQDIWYTLTSRKRAFLLKLSYKVRTHPDFNTAQSQSEFTLSWVTTFEGREVRLQNRLTARDAGSYRNA